MSDYKELYFTLFRATEQALNILIAAQQRCEELYISQPEVELTVVEFHPENPNRTDKT